MAGCVWLTFFGAQEAIAGKHARRLGGEQRWRLPRHSLLAQLNVVKDLFRIFRIFFEQLCDHALKVIPALWDRSLTGLIRHWYRWFPAVLLPKPTRRQIGNRIPFGLVVPGTHHSRRGQGADRGVEPRVHRDRRQLTRHNLDPLRRSGPLREPLGLLFGDDGVFARPGVLGVVALEPANQRL